jgi:ubiquitin carboxyl-terminal hydrolase 10
MAASTPSLPQQSQTTPLVTKRTPFYPKLPWFSVPESEFPPRTRRRRRRLRVDAAVSLDMPERASAHTPEEATPLYNDQTEVTEPEALSIPSTPSKSVAVLQSSVGTESTPQSISQPSPSQVTPKSHVKPALPVIPVSVKPAATKQPKQATQEPAQVEVSSGDAAKVSEAPVVDGQPEDAASPPPAAKTAPKSWADLVRTKAAATPISQSTANGEPSEAQLAKSKSASLAEVIRSFNVAIPSKFAFLEPRGLVNTGNMCYMNSVRHIHSIELTISNLTCLDSTSSCILYTFL